MRRDLRFIVFNREDLKVQPFADFLKLQRQHFLLTYFKTLSAGPAGVELTTSRVTARSISVAQYEKHTCRQSWQQVGCSFYQGNDCFLNLLITYFLPYLSFAYLLFPFPLPGPAGPFLYSALYPSSIGRINHRSLLC